MLRQLRKLTKAHLLIVAFLSIGATIITASQSQALSPDRMNVTVDTGVHSASSYPLDTVTVRVQIQPGVEDLNKTIAIAPLITKYQPTTASDANDWNDDIDQTVDYQYIVPTSTGTITLEFEQQLVTQGSNYIGCIAARDDFDIYDEATWAFCSNAEPVVYTGTLLPIWRFYSSRYTSHFFTLDHDEKTGLILNNPDWRYERPAYKAHSTQAGQSGNIALYRFWSKTKRSHFYTASATERDQVMQNYPDDVWKYEKVAYYVQPYTGTCPSGTSPIYRFWSKSQQSHFYTKSASERDQIRSKYPEHIWRYEGPKFCAW
jgi:hypothetical protein